MAKKASNQNSTEGGDLFSFIVFAVIVIVGVSQLLGNGGNGNASGRKKPNYKFDGKYDKKYDSDKSRARSLPTPTEAKKTGKSLLGGCKFLLCAKEHLKRDYILVVDRSFSMSGERWREAGKAVEAIAPYICKFDHDGIDLILFDDTLIEVDGVKDASMVKEVFSKYKPSGSTDLARALDAAFSKHFSAASGATTILVVTDGAPNDQNAVKRVICKAARSIGADAELSVSFLQIGNDRSATEFLQHLDDDLEALGPSVCPYDIVDVVPATAMVSQKMSFAELIANSIYD